MQPGAGGLSGEFAESTEIMYTTIIINGFWSSLSNYRTASRDVLLVSQHVQLSRRTRMCEFKLGEHTGLGLGTPSVHSIKSDCSSRSVILQGLQELL